MILIRGSNSNSSKTFRGIDVHWSNFSRPALRTFEFCSVVDSSSIMSKGTGTKQTNSVIWVVRPMYICVCLCKEPWNENDTVVRHRRHDGITTNLPYPFSFPSWRERGRGSRRERENERGLIRAQCDNRHRISLTRQWALFNSLPPIRFYCAVDVNERPSNISLTRQTLALYSPRTDFPWHFLFFPKLNAIAREQTLIPEHINGRHTKEVDISYSSLYIREFEMSTFEL